MKFSEVRHSGRSRIKLTVLVLGTSAVTAVTGTALAAGSGAGKISLFVTGNGANKQKVLVAGAIGDWGSGTSVDANGKPSINGNFEKLTLRKGSILINATKFNAAGNNPRPVMRSNSTCSGVFTWSAPVSIVSGTGAYQGVTGTLNVKGTFAGVTPRFKSGPRKGQCDMGANVQPLALYVSVTGTGQVNLG